MLYASVQLREGWRQRPEGANPIVAVGGGNCLKMVDLVMTYVGAVREPPEIGALLEAPLHRNQRVRNYKTVSETHGNGCWSAPPGTTPSSHP